MCLEYLCLIHELQLKAEAKFQHACFLMSARPDEVTSLERLRGVLRHDELGEQIEDSVFDALPERQAPSLGQMLGDIDNLLVEIVRSVDDGKCVH